MGRSTRQLHEQGVSSTTISWPEVLHLGGHEQDAPSLWNLNGLISNDTVLILLCLGITFTLSVPWLLLIGRSYGGSCWRRALFALLYIVNVAPPMFDLSTDIVFLVRFYLATRRASELIDDAVSKVCLCIMYYHKYHVVGGYTLQNTN
jgi:hypothetical protein